MPEQADSDRGRAPPARSRGIRWNTTRPRGITRESRIRLICGPSAIQIASRVRRRPRLGGLLDFHQRAVIVRLAKKRNITASRRIIRCEPSGPWSMRFSATCRPTSPERMRPPGGRRSSGAAPARATAANPLLDSERAAPDGTTRIQRSGTPVRAVANTRASIHRPNCNANKVMAPIPTSTEPHQTGCARVSAATAPSAIAI
jgi:hypothetical protein